VFEEAEQQRAKGLAKVAEERAKGLAEVAEERAKGLAMVDARQAELHAEVAAMHKHKEAQEGRVELNIGGYRFQTSIQALRRVPHTFFDAYFSGRYAQDVCDDGSIFVDRDGEHFGHVLEYMRDGCVSVAAPGVRPSVSLLRALKREFGFYCIELVSEQLEVAYVMGAYEYGHSNRVLSSMEQYDASSGQWSTVAAMDSGRYIYAACVVAGEIYVTLGDGGNDDDRLSSVEKYTPSSDTWSTVATMPAEGSAHAAVAVGSAMYVLGGYDDHEVNTSVLTFDSTQDAWSQVAPMPEARHGHAACAVGSDIFVFGGSSARGRQASVFKYDTVANKWGTLAPMPLTSNSYSASVLDGLVYIVGADDNGGGVLRFDPVSGAWSTLASTLGSKAVGAPFVLGGCLYAVGGQLAEQACVERYDVASNMDGHGRHAPGTLYVCCRHHRIRGAGR
jgi:hypothetical protein